MPPHIEWLISERVLYFNLEGDVDRACFSAVNAAVAAFVLEGQAPIHLVADIQDLRSLSMNVQWISKTTAIRSERVGYIMVVGAKGFFNFTTKAVRLLTKTKIHMVATIEDALAELWDLDASLPRSL